MQSTRTTYTELVVKGMMLFAILTVIQSISAFEDVNKIWMAVFPAHW